MATSNGNLVCPTQVMKRVQCEKKIVRLKYVRNN